MKKIGLLLLLTVIMLTTACEDKNSFTLTGNVTNPDMNGKEVYLQELNEEGTGFQSIDTTIIENNKFTFKGIADGAPKVLFVTIAEPRSMPNLFIMELGKIEMTIDSTATVKGTPMNDSYQELSIKRDDINAKMKALGEEYSKLVASGINPEDEERVRKAFEENVKGMSQIIFDFVKPNMTNPVGEFFFNNTGNMMEEDQLLELLAIARPEFKQNERIQLLEKQLIASKKTAIGQPFVDIKGKTPDGKDISLSDYAGKGKVVLIDFWASWCEPCTKEMPTVVEAYKKYKNKGFEIVGVSIDENGEAWKKGIDKLNITWPQMSDLKGWDSELSGAYAVSGVPYTILLDKDGKIIEKQLRGENLLTTLDKLLN